MTAPRAWKRRVSLLAAGGALAALVWAGSHLDPPRSRAAEDASTARARAPLGMVVRSVEIRGRVNTPPAALEAAIGEVVGKSAAVLDLALIRQRIERISWVREASVMRRLPDRLVISLVERTPFALWQHDRKLHLVDREGVLLTGTDLARWRSYPLIVGEGAPEAAPGLLAELARHPDLSQAIEAAVRLGGRRWDLTLHNGMRVKLPEDGTPGWNLAAALDRLVELARRENLLERAVTVIDLRLPDRLVLRLPPGIRPRPLEGEQRT